MVITPKIKIVFAVKNQIEINGQKYLLCWIAENNIRSICFCLDQV